MKNETRKDLYFILDCIKLILGSLLVVYFTFYKKDPDHLLSIIGGSIIALSHVKISFKK